MKPISIEKFKGDFFKVLGGTEISQVAVMTIEPGSDSGAYGLHNGDQVVFVVEGQGRLEVEGLPDGKAGENWQIKAYEVAIIPKGKKHKIFNEGKEVLFFLNVYAPPEY